MQEHVDPVDETFAAEGAPLRMLVQYMDGNSHATVVLKAARRAPARVIVVIPHVSREDVRGDELDSALRTWTVSCSAAVIASQMLVVVYAVRKCVRAAVAQPWELDTVTS